MESARASSFRPSLRALSNRRFSGYRTSRAPEDSFGRGLTGTPRRIQRSALASTFLPDRPTVTSVATITVTACLRRFGTTSDTRSLRRDLVLTWDLPAGILRVDSAGRVNGYAALNAGVLDYDSRL